MNSKQLIVVIGIVVALFASMVQAHGPKGEFYRLTSTQIIAIFGGRTIYSVNERKKYEVKTYLSKDGTMKQSIDSLDVKRKGKWHAANNRLCLHFDSDDSEYCFDSILMHDDIFYLFKDRKIETVVHDAIDGDQTGF